MDDQPVKPKQIKHLTLVWVRDESGGSALAKAPAATLLEKAGLPQTREPVTSQSGIPDPLERLPDDCFRAQDVADLPDDYFKKVGDDPKEVEEVRLKLRAMDCPEEMSQVFLDGDWWFLSELHDEYRRACSGSGELSGKLARAAGFDFIVGAAQSLAFRGDGPLSTPLTFTSEYGQEPTWNEEAISLNAPCRQDAVELSGSFSFMMH